MLNDLADSDRYYEKSTLLTNLDYRAKMSPVSRKETTGFWSNPTATLLYEDYLGFIARYNIKYVSKSTARPVLTGRVFFIRLITLAEQKDFRPRK